MSKRVPSHEGTRPFQRLFQRVPLPQEPWKMRPWNALPQGHIYKHNYFNRERNNTMENITWILGEARTANHTYARAPEVKDTEVKTIRTLQLVYCCKLAKMRDHWGLKNYCKKFLGIFPKILVTQIIPKLVNFPQILWEIFPKNREFSKTIVETSFTYFSGIFPKKIKIGNFPKLLWTFSPHIFGEYSQKFGNLPNYLGNIS